MGIGKAKTGEADKPRPGFGMQVPFGPMLAFAGAAYFLFLHGRVDAWFARFSDLF
jgi:hypothetical protein